MQIIIAVVVIGLIGLIFGCLLEYASIIFHVEKDTRIDKITECLPGANCGGCGFAGCGAYAAAVVNNGEDVAKCSVGGNKTAEKIAEIMGVKAVKTEKKIARVMCRGTCENCADKYTYYGVNDCRVASKLAGGLKECGYGCLGLGSCAEACKFGAISIVNGIAKINPELCVGCGMCAQVCPRNIIELTSGKIIVKCRNRDKGAMANKVCKASCIGCGLCARSCPQNAITIENNLAVIDYSKCVGCGICKQRCPKKAIE